MSISASFLPRLLTKSPLSPASSTRMTCTRMASANSALSSRRIVTNNARIRDATFKRFYSSDVCAKPISKPELEALMKDKTKKFTLIDVREPDEIAHGKIPGAFVVPVGTFPTEFAKTPEQFKTSLGFDKPSLDDTVVLYCKAGVRANNAAVYLVAHGYEDVYVYPGFMDWFGRAY